MTDATTYAGIDVAKDRLDVVLRPSGEYVQASTSRPPTTSGASGRWCVASGRRSLALVVLEATGGWSGPPGCRWPSSTPGRSGARDTGKLAKTDRIDAAVLAHFAGAVRPEPRPLADEHARELSAVLLRRRQILATTTAEGNRVLSPRRKP